MDRLLGLGLANALMATVLAVMAAAVSTLCPRPALRHGLWLLVLLKLLTPPFMPMPVRWLGPSSAALTATAPEPDPTTEVLLLSEPSAVDIPDPDARPAAPVLPLETTEPPRPQVGSASSHPPGGRGPSSLPPGGGGFGWGVWALRSCPGPLWRAAVIFWPVGSLLWLAWTGLQVRRFHRLQRRALPAHPALQARAQRLARRMGLARCPDVRTLPGAISPMLWAVGRARLLLPEGLLGRLDPSQQAALLAHELAHLRRRDHWVRIVELIATGLFWWHPIQWWARREIREAEEQCCDAWAVWALGGVGRPYALALLRAVEFVSQSRPALPVAASGIGQVPHLRRRLTMIMQGATPRSLSWPGCLAVFGIGLFLLPLVPVQAQTGAPATQVGSDSRADEIQTLRRIIATLEKQGQSDVHAKKADPVEQRVAHEEVRLLTEAVAARRAELQAAEEKLRRATIRLADLEGRKPDETHVFRVIAAPLHLGDMKYHVMADGTMMLTEDSKEPGKRKIGVRVITAPSGTPKDTQRQFREKITGRPEGRKTEDLDERLDRMMRELEELRREIRKDQVQGDVDRSRALLNIYTRKIVPLPPAGAAPIAPVLPRPPRATVPPAPPTPPADPDEPPA